MVRNTPTRVKDIWVKDETGKAKVTLWREKCDMNVRPGDFVSITDIVTNTYRSETS
jgi:ssDNA-binding replication factor A large subunit